MNRARLDGILVVLAVLGVWEASALLGLINPAYLPRVSQIVAAGAASFASGELPGHIVTTLRGYVQGFALAALLGIGLGVVMGLSVGVRGALATTIELLRPMPSVAIIPIAIVAFGLDDPMKRFVIMYAALWPVLINTLYGVAGVDPLLIEMARSFRLSAAARAWKVILPAAAPYIATGLRVSSGIALILAVTVEMVASRQGLGYFITDTQLSYHIPEMYAGILVIGAVGYGLNALFVALERRALAWHYGPAERSRA